MARIEEMAKELGEAMGRTDEYQALRRAASAVDDERELVELRNQLAKLESGLVETLRAGEEPEQSVREEYETLAGRLQVHPAYQSLVVAQANFDKVLQKVNDTIAQGIHDGATSRIILSS